jgi:hypothetical protein
MHSLSAFATPLSEMTPTIPAIVAATNGYRSRPIIIDLDNN